MSGNANGSTNAMECETDSLRKVAELRKKMEEQAKELIENGMPKKILALDEICQNMPEMSLDVEQFRRTVQGDLESEDEPPAKKRKLVEGSTNLTTESVERAHYRFIPSNKTIASIAKIHKEELTQMIDSMHTIRIWIKLNIPCIEDGNNFGVGVQEDIAGELMASVSNAFSMFGDLSEYYQSRGKLVSKILKYPTIEDYQSALIELDEKEYQNLRIAMTELRDIYRTCHDLIIKNRKKLEKPRSSHSNSLY